MSSWKFEYASNAQKKLEKLDRATVEHIFERLEWFAAHFDECTLTPLHHEWKGFFKFRVGDWRIVYVPDPLHQIIRIHDIDRRDRIYRKKR